MNLFKSIVTLQTFIKSFIKTSIVFFAFGQLDGLLGGNFFSITNDLHDDFACIIKHQCFTTTNLDFLFQIDEEIFSKETGGSVHPMHSWKRNEL